MRPAAPSRPRRPTGRRRRPRVRDERAGGSHPSPYAHCATRIGAQGSGIRFPVRMDFLRDTLKYALKRGALIAAANWPVVVVQEIADSLFKVLVAMPLIGGVFLVALVLGAEPVALMSLGWRDLIATIVASLASRPLVLTALLAALGVVLGGGSLFVLLVKAGTVTVLVKGDRAAGPIERPPLHFSTVMTASAFSLETFQDGARALFPRYARLGLALLTIYVVTGGIYLALVLASRNAGESWGMTALFTAAFVGWITVLNFVYLLTQIVIAAEDCNVTTAARHVAHFLRRARRPVAAVFLVILAIVVFATGASLIATAALGLISFVPLLGLTVLPLQLGAWLFRGLVFQYVGLASIGAYLKLYRSASAAAEGVLFADWAAESI